MPWANDSNGLHTYNQIAVTDGDDIIVLGDLAQFAGSPYETELWASAYAYATAYAAALNASENATTMTDRNGILDQIEERLGPNGSRAEAEEMLEHMRAEGSVTFDAVAGFTFTDSNTQEGK